MNLKAEMDHPSVATQIFITYISKKANVKQVSTLVTCLVYSATLMLEAIRSSETSVDFNRITRPYIADDRTLHNQRCENLKSCVSTKELALTSQQQHQQQHFT
jgi:hypothetical protein